MFLRHTKGKVYYELKRAREKKACLVFLHGFGGDLSVWRFFEKLAIERGRSFMSIDLPGHGLSFRLDSPMEMKEFAFIVKEILEKERIKKIILFGHCFGGMVSLEIALYFPEILERMFLICTSYRLPLWRKLFFPFLFFLRRVKMGPKIEHVDFEKFRGTGDFDFERLFSDIIHVGLDSYLNIYEGIKDWNKKGELEKIKIPVLVIGGEKDKVFPKRTQLVLAKKLPKADLKFLRTNHIAPVNAVAELIELIGEDLRVFSSVKV